MKRALWVPVATVVGLGALGLWNAPPAAAQWPYAQPAVRPAYVNPQFNHSEAELAQFIAKWMPGYKAEGAARAGRLEGFQPFAVNLKRGRCYLMVLKLQPGAQWSPHAKGGVSFIYQPHFAGPTVNGGPGIHGPGGIGSAGCPQTSGAFTFDVQAIWGSATDKSKLHDLGVGPFTLQLFGKPVSEQQLGAQAADTRRQIAESEAFKRRSIRDTCIRCSHDKDDCFDGRHRPFGGSCVSEYRSCLQRGSVYNEGDCFAR